MIPVLKSPLLTELPLEQIIFEGDLQTRTELLRDDDVSLVMSAEQVTLPVRTELLRTSVRLTPRMLPEVFRVIDRCAERLQLTGRIELYVTPTSSLNAWVHPVEDGCVLIVCTSALLERLDEDELTGVLGHELGHVLFDHHRFIQLQPLIEQPFGLSRRTALRYYAWKRYAEVTADRAGLLCSGDPQAMARGFFKIFSGLTSPSMLRDVDALTRQYVELSGEPFDASESDWFATHPHGPLRMKALGLFAQSSRFASLLMATNARAAPAPAPEAPLVIPSGLLASLPLTQVPILAEPLPIPASVLPDETYEAEIASILGLMNPAELDEDRAWSQASREFLAVGALCVALADGRLGRRELRALGQLGLDRSPSLARLTAQAREAARALASSGLRDALGQARAGTIGVLAEDLVAGLRDRSLVRALGADARWARERLAATAQVLREQMPLGRRKRLLEDLVTIAAADGLLHPREIEALYAIGALVEVEAAFVDEVLARVRAKLD